MDLNIPALTCNPVSGGASWLVRWRSSGGYPHPEFAVGRLPRRLTPGDGRQVSAAHRCGNAASPRLLLLRAFREAASKRGWRVLAADCDRLAPALYMADKAIRLPRISHPDYLKVLLDVVRQYQVRLLVPTIDPEFLFY